MTMKMSNHVATHQLASPRTAPLRWFRLLTIAAALLLGCALQANVMAQWVETNDTEQEDFDIDQYAESNRMNIDFGGGTVSEFIEGLQQELPKLNVLIRPEVRELQLPKLKMKNVSASSLLHSLDQLSSDILFVESTGDYFLIGRSPHLVPDRVVAIRLGAFIDHDDSARSAEAMSKLMETVEAGIQLLPQSGSLKISLHPDTRMLFVKGNAEEVRLVEQIVRELDRSAVPVSDMGPGVRSGLGAGGGAAGGAGFGGSDDRAPAP